jgi:hypothetical protein
MTRRFASSDAFKASIETRLRAEATMSGGNVQRLRQMVVFDRFLARVHAVFPERVIVKGGVVLELRLSTARTTRDVDVSIAETPRRVAAGIEDIAQVDVSDPFRFVLARDAKHPTIEGDAVRYGGFRYRGEAHLGRAIYGAPFGVDVVFGHDLYGVPDVLQSRPFLNFIGIPPTFVRATNRETHLAEKLHAYTQPRPTPNSRVKDLPDIALLAETGPMRAEVLRGAISHIFARRNTHPTPVNLPAPSSAWATPYARIAEQNGLRWRSLADVFGAAASFIDPILAGEGGVWNPGNWSWGVL